MIVRNQIAKVGYNLVFEHFATKLECNQIAAADCNLAEVEILHILIVEVYNYLVESLVLVVCMGKVGNLVVTEVERIQFVLAYNLSVGAHNHSLKMADLNIRERLNHNLGYLVYWCLVDLEHR